MKTSPSQFKLMVTFMEQHGDLNKPSPSSGGKIAALRNWEELTNLLNSDGGGDSKNTEKWKKVWSDLKNNTKKKVARLHKAASGNGNGATCYTKLTDLEQRVLNLMGVQAATSFADDEAEMSKEVHMNEITCSPVLSVSTISSNVDIENIQFVKCAQFQFIQPGPNQMAMSSPPLLLPEIPASPQNFAAEVKVECTDMLTPTPPGSLSPVDSPPVQPAPFGQTTPENVRPKQHIPRRRVRPANLEEAAKRFLHSNEQWRKFKRQQHRDYMDIRREQNRIRAMEVQASREWRELGNRAMDLFDKLFNKYCQD